jgi:TPR repeat protein
MSPRPTASFSLRRKRLDEAARFALGEGRPQSYARAIKLYRLESGAGSGEATFNLATMYARGEGVRKNWSRANKLFRLAEQQGDGDASMVLGEFRLLRKGDGRSNARGAIFHFAVAVLHGDRRGLREMAHVIATTRALRSSDVSQALRKAFLFGVNPQEPKRRARPRELRD